MGKAMKRGNMAKKESKPSKIIKKKVARNTKPADKKNTTTKTKVRQPKSQSSGRNTTKKSKYRSSKEKKSSNKATIDVDVSVRVGAKTIAEEHRHIDEAELE